jgi:glycine cleavage system H lipoate-binding protein
MRGRVARCLSFTATHVKVTEQDISLDKKTWGALEAIVASSKARIRMGLSEQAAATIGDVTKIKAPRVGDVISKSSSAVDFHWEGYGQSEGDELYHTAWTNLAGVYNVRLPFDCKVVGVNDVLLRPRQLSVEDDWLLELEVDVGEALPFLLDADEYARFCRSEAKEPGKKPLVSFT